MMVSSWQNISIGMEDIEPWVNMSQVLITDFFHRQRIDVGDINVNIQRLITERDDLDRKLVSHFVLYLLKAVKKSLF